MAHRNPWPPPVVCARCGVKCASIKAHECAPVVRTLKFGVGDLVRDAERYVGVCRSIEERSDGFPDVFMTIRVENGVDIPRRATLPVTMLARKGVKVSE